MTRPTGEEEALVCQARSSRTAALWWTTGAFFAGFAGVSAFAPVAPQLAAWMDLSPLRIGLMVAIPTLTGSLLRIPFGVLVDRTGGKPLILGLLGATSLGIAGIAVLLALNPEPGPGLFPLFLFLGALCGCGIATFSVGIPTLSYWHPQGRQGRVLAVYAGLGNLAPGGFALLLPIVVAELGLGPAYAGWLVALLAWLALFAFFMRDAPYFQYRARGLPLREDELSRACAEELFPSGSATASLRTACRSARAWTLTFFYFGSFGGFVALTVWFPAYWTGLFGMSLVAAGALTALYSVSASLLRVLGGVCSDRFGGEPTLFASLLVTAVGAGVMMATRESLAAAVTGLVLLALGMGFANAGVFKLVPRQVPDAVGGAAGLVGGLGALGGFLLPLVFSGFVQAAGPRGYPLGFSVLLALALGSLGLLVAPWRVSGGKRKTVRPMGNPHPS